jgi:NAD(P)-dependent dehydrogenase (short-subunit alcohol dehydrogenase family)
MNVRDLLDFLDFAPQTEAILEDHTRAAALVLLGLGFLTAWLLRGLVDVREIRALNVQSQQLNTDIDSVRIQLAVRHERLELAGQREETLAQAVEQARAEFGRLHELIKSSANPVLISKSATSTAQAVEQTTAANTVLRSTLSVRWLSY